MDANVFRIKRVPPATSEIARQFVEPGDPPASESPSRSAGEAPSPAPDAQPASRHDDKPVASVSQTTESPSRSAGEAPSPAPDAQPANQPIYEADDDLEEEKSIKSEMRVARVARSKSTMPFPPKPTKSGNSKRSVYARADGRMLRKITIYMPEELAVRLKTFAVTQGQDVSTLLCQLADKHLAKKGWP